MRNQLLVLTTHLDSGAGASGSTIRSAQVAGLLSNWASQPQTVLLGDMNAGFGSREMQGILDAGLLDTWGEAGRSARAGGDWIFHTPGLMVSEALRIDSPASDHAAVVATFVSRP